MVLTSIITTYVLVSTQGYLINHGKKAKKKLAAPDISLTLDRSEGSVLSDELDESTELDLDDIDTPSDNSNEFEWEGKIFVSYHWQWQFSTFVLSFNTSVKFRLMWWGGKWKQTFNLAQVKSTRE